MRKFYLFLIIAVILGSMITFDYLFSALNFGMNNRQGVIVFSQKINMSIMLSGNLTIGLAVTNKSLDFGTVSPNGKGVKNFKLTNNNNFTSTYFFNIDGNISKLNIRINNKSYDLNNKIILKPKQSSDVKIDVSGDNEAGIYNGTLFILGLRGNITSLNLSS